MRFLNPKTDFAFKKIFGSEGSEPLLVSFLNAMLGLCSPYRITEVEILDPYQAPKILGMKDTYVDVRAKDETGKHYIIEMQVLNMEGFEQRVLYNACKAYASQLGSGEGYQLLTEVIALTITDFVMFKEQVEVISKFKLRNSQGHIYHDDLELVFAELPKFSKSEDQLERDQDRWLYFLKSARDLSVIPPALKQEPSIVRAFEIANRAGLTQEEEEAQTRREIFIQDQRGVREKALNEGRVEGWAEGRAEGRAEGLEEGRAEGREEGRAEGQIEGEIKLLKRMLIQRFGTLPPWALDKLQSARPEQLQTWSEAIFHSESLEEIIK